MIIFYYGRDNVESQFSVKSIYFILHNREQGKNIRGKI